MYVARGLEVLWEPKDGWEGMLELDLDALAIEEIACAGKDKKTVYGLYTIDCSVRVMDLKLDVVLGFSLFLKRSS